MSELKIEENKFYILTKNNGESETTLHNDLDSPIDKIREYLDGGTEPDELELLSVEMEEKQFTIKTYPWSKIASRLVRRG
ncbi:hypothetical protein AKJ45_00930 [candidate division MSBL1 archaeon SCGC-AAA261F19]|uniref:Uncharacterized protein n=2 Tax=candidate division MSBL1 TaxID=215777 RepID=A0A133VB35_9EURY|nr:hypothetical protein AKJ43_02850 [candidate division MSBL1 archaeon SCGC-AAA261D19]KXB03661.1 hypothetical protein AKJ45_00930 [candidate division MSBL1 archaeon SCGC-AAA261F19]